MIKSIPITVMVYDTQHQESKKNIISLVIMGRSCCSAGRQADSQLCGGSGELCLLCVSAELQVCVE